MTLPTVDVLGMPLARIDRRELLDHVFQSLAEGRGGWVVTANLDFLRRFRRSAGARALYSASDVTVADGMPLVWAARLQGQPLPERVAGASLVWPIAERAAGAGCSIYLLGGAPGVAEAAQAELQRSFPELRVAGRSSPRVSNPPSIRELERMRADLARCRPDIVLVALGSPKQEEVIRALRPAFPAAWMIGVGISLSFVAGRHRRAPAWMRRAGLEWLHRLAQEPRRLGRRYLIDDVPFAIELFARVLWRRWFGRSNGSTSGDDWAN